MQKLQTAYTMFFNRKYQRTGSLFQSKYRSDIAHSDDTLKHFFAHVHLNPAELFNQYWQESHDGELLQLAWKAMRYRYSSINEYATSQFVITSPEEFPKYLRRSRDAEGYVRLWRGGMEGVGR